MTKPARVPQRRRAAEHQPRSRRGEFPQTLKNQIRLFQMLDHLEQRNHIEPARIGQQRVIAPQVGDVRLEALPAAFRDILFREIDAGHTMAQRGSARQKLSIGAADIQQRSRRKRRERAKRFLVIPSEFVGFMRVMRRAPRVPRLREFQPASPAGQNLNRIGTNIAAHKPFYFRRCRIAVHGETCPVRGQFAGIESLRDDHVSGAACRARHAGRSSDS